MTGGSGDPTTGGASMTGGSGDPTGGDLPMMGDSCTPTSGPIYEGIYDCNMFCAQAVLLGPLGGCTDGDLYGNDFDCDFFGWDRGECIDEPILETYASASCEDEGGNLNIVGDRISAYYNPDGTWNNSTSSGFEIGNLAGEKFETCFPGAPWQIVGVEWMSGMTTNTYTGNYSGSSWDWDTTCRDALGDGATTTGAIHEWTMGDLHVTKTEIWEVSGQVSRVWFDITNKGTEPVSDLDVMFGMDPDQDSIYFGTTNTDNDINNAGDYDGLASGAVVTSAGSTSKRSVIYGRCNADDEVVGHATSWVTDVDFEAYDYDGLAGDKTMY